MAFTMFRRVLAAGLLAALVAAIPSAAAAASGVLAGRVVAADGMTPLEGVVVALVDAKTQQTVVSATADAAGVFRASAPQGTYRVVAETKKGAYLTQGAVKVAAGANPPVSLTLKDAAVRQDPGAPPAGGQDELATWAKWTIVGAIVVTGVLVVDAVADDESSATPF
jgi:hypothetical protein